MNKVILTTAFHVSGLLNVKLSNGEHLLKGKKITGMKKIEQEGLDCKHDLPFCIEDKLKEQVPYR